MARLKEKQYYLKNGLMTVDKLTRPRLIPNLRLNLPRESIYHFFQDSGAVVGPSPADPVIRAILNDGSPRLFVEHVTKLIGSEGPPRRTPLNPLIMENEFRRKNRQFRPLRQDKALTINPLNVLIVNYNLLNPLYRYIASYKAGFFRWKNNTQTFWNSVSSIHERFGWNQFIELELPATLPKFSDFNLMANGPTQQNLKKFHTQSLLNLFDLFTWLGEDRANSLMSAIPVEAFDKINFILRTRTHFAVINLGKLNQWRKDPTLEKDVGLAPRAMQRKFMVLMQGLLDFNANVIALETDENNEAVLNIHDPEEAIEQTAPVQSDSETDVIDPTSDADEEGVVQDNQPDADSLLPELDLSMDIEAPMVPTSVDNTLELDDEDSEPVALVDEEVLEDAYLQEPVKAQTNRLTQAVVERAWELSEVGLISPASYRRAIEDSQTYQKLPDPFGSGKTIAEAMAYSAEDFELPEEEAFPDTDTIVDKSMLKSKLKSMQQKYTQVLMKKDILNAVMAVQQQGVSITGYEVETVEDEMNHYQIHTVTIRPLRGRQSTVRFRLPVVDRDGRFVSNGTKQRMRLQRGDVPLRKVAPSRVALTSYYNKTFVVRSERVINDYDKWLIRLITARGLDKDDQSITDLRYTNGLSSEFKLPRIYTLLANRFKQFKAGDITFYLNYPDRFEFLKANNRVVDESPFSEGFVPVGLHANGKVMLVDYNNTFYLEDQGDEQGMEVLGTLTDILDIDTSKAPVEAAYMSVSNKTLPVGFVLAYQFGLSKLIESLGAEVSRHQRGERLNVGPDDYTLVFQDEVRVFSKLDYRATLILSGLNLYHRTLKRFSVWDFDKKDVYFRILEEAELGVRYLREIDTLFQAWVDPITLGMLEEMGEPTTFGPLVVRACELLMDDYSPSEVDPAFMRYRGYERFAGVVYGELTRSVKAFNNRGASGDQAVELKPHEVWQRIVQDPSVTLVEEANPIANLREQEAMTYRGDGGRSGKSMVERTRIYHENDQGTVSESTVDSGDVGVVAYLTPDANFTNLRGNTRPFDPKIDPPSKLFSSSALLAPCSSTDDQLKLTRLLY